MLYLKLSWRIAGLTSETVNVQMKSVSLVYPALALVLKFIMTALIVVYVGIFNWDNGAITLAYSRTFAELGASPSPPLRSKSKAFLLFL